DDEVILPRFTQEAVRGFTQGRVQGACGPGGAAGAQDNRQRDDENIFSPKRFPQQGHQGRTSLPTALGSAPAAFARRANRSRIRVRTPIITCSYRRPAMEL